MLQSELSSVKNRPKSNKGQERRFVAAGCYNSETNENNEFSVDSEESQTDDLEREANEGEDISIEGVESQADDLYSENTDSIVEDEHLVTETRFDEIILMDNDFEDLIENNSIDRALKWEDSGSANRIRLAVKYRDAWKIEIEDALKKLKDLLMEEDYASLVLAHEEWEQYMEKTQALEIELFYPGYGYGTGGGDTYPRVMETMALRTKKYAVTLLSYEYALSGTIEFVYTE